MSLTKSNGAPSWKRSSQCTANGCVEVAAAAQSVSIRDSKLPDSPVLRLTPQEFAGFLDSIKAGELDIPA